MSPAPEDQPTRQVPPARTRTPKAGAPPPPEPAARTWEQELADRIASLKNWVALLGIVGVAALGVAIYALVQANDDTTNGSGASSSQLRDLRSRVSDLEDSSSSDTAVSQLKSDVNDLSQKVDKLQSANSNSDAVSPSDFQALRQQVSDLSQEIADLQSQSGQ